MALDRARPRLFLSHCHTDTEYCRVVADHLRRHGIDTYFYEDDPQSGMIAEIIQRQLESRECFVLIMSQDALTSDWVQREIFAAQELERRGALRMFLPVLATPVDVPPMLAIYKRVQDATGGPVRALDAADRILLAIPRSSTQTTTPNAAFTHGITTHNFPHRLAELGFAAYTLNGVELILSPMCEVPSGAFCMGSDRTQDVAAFDDETPQREVDVERFEIAQFPVTVAEYDCFVRNGGQEPRWRVHDLEWQDQLDDMTRPVVNVTFQNATAYAKWLSVRTGDLWRLPTEAQWEKAARWDQAQQLSLTFPWGQTFDETRCNTERSGHGAPTRVGEYPSGASPYGAEDMAGNVWEWTRSRHQRYPYIATDGRESESGIGARVLRGGSWASSIAEVRSANRRTASLTNALAFDEYGFRLVRLRQE